MGKFKRILLAEDNANDIELSLAAFQETNQANQVAVVRDGVEVLDYLYRRGAHTKRPSEQPCVIVLDIKMPKLVGLEVLRAIKTDERLKALPVTMLTSSRKQSDLLRSYELGVNAYVVKPVGFSQFSAAVRQLGKYWGRDQQPAAQLPEPAMLRLTDENSRALPAHCLK